MAEKTRYSDAELEEFRAIIMEKLELAQRDYELLKASLTGADGNDTDDTSPTYKVLEEGANTLSKEETTRLAQRQLKFIQGQMEITDILCVHGETQPKLLTFLHHIRCRGLYLYGCPYPDCQTT